MISSTSKALPHLPTELQRHPLPQSELDLQFPPHFGSGWKFKLKQGNILKTNSPWSLQFQKLLHVHIYMFQKSCSHIQFHSPKRMCIFHHTLAQAVKCTFVLFCNKIFDFKDCNFTLKMEVSLAAKLMMPAKDREKRKQRMMRAFIFYLCLQIWKKEINTSHDEDFSNAYLINSNSWIGQE